MGKKCLRNKMTVNSYHGTIGYHFSTLILSVFSLLTFLYPLLLQSPYMRPLQSERSPKYKIQIFKNQRVEEFVIHKQKMTNSSPSVLLLDVALNTRDTFLLSMERREARRTDSWVILCRRPAREWRSLREQRTELRRELWAAPAMAILAAVRPGEGSGWRAISADKRSVGEMLTITSGEGILGGDGSAGEVLTTTPDAGVLGGVLGA